MTLVLRDDPYPGIVALTLNDPERLNPLSRALVAELHAHLDDLDADSATRVVVLTGAGRGFCSGADLTPAPGPELRPAPRQNPISFVLGIQERLASLHERIHRMRAPVIAAVNGPAVGGGFSLALACDLRYAAASARFGSVFIKLGISSADMGTSYFLPRIVGATRAAELMLTGRVFTAQEAMDYGLVLDLVPEGQVLDRALSTAREIATNSPLGVWMTKETLWQTIDNPSLRHALDIENRTQVMCTASGEMDVAREAFATRVAPDWMHL